MRRKMAVLAAVLTALTITACGDGGGVVINGTTAAEARNTGAVTEHKEPESSGEELRESTGGCCMKIEIVTGETTAAESMEGQTEPETTVAETTQAPKPTAAPTTAAPETTAAKVYEVKDLNKTMYATTSVRVRKSYSTSSDVLGSYGKGQEAKITGESANGWMRVEYNGQTGYVAKSYLSDTKPEEESSSSTSGGSTSGGNTSGGSKPSGSTPGGSTSGGSTSGGSTPGGSTPGGSTSGGSPSGGTPGGTPGGSTSGGSTSGGSPSGGTPGGSPGGSTSGGTSSGGTGSGSSVTGNVTALDPTGVTIQSSDGTSHQFFWGGNVPELAPGERVTIYYTTTSSGQRQVTQAVK